jgi:hypothetical protein
LKKVLIVKKSEVEVRPFILDDFTQDKETHSSIKKVTKKELRNFAGNLGLKYEDSDIVFTKKIITAYLKKMNLKELK